MSRNVLLALFALLFVGLSGLYYLHFSEQKIVYVDSARLINGYQGMLDARNAYQKKAQIWQGNVDTLAKEVQKAITDYEKESPALTKKEKELSQELIRTKQKRLADYQKAIGEKAAQEDGQMTSAVLEEINAYLKSYGESRNYRIIIAATEYGNVAYAADGLDITDAVLDGLNNEYAGQ